MICVALKVVYVRVLLSLGYIKSIRYFSFRFFSRNNILMQDFSRQLFS